MPRPPRTAALALLLLMAGCVGAGVEDAPRPPREDAPPEATETPIKLPSCDVFEAVVAVAPEAARPHVPEDFDLVLHGGKALVALGGLVCGEGGATGKRGILAIAVEPRAEELRAGNDVNHFWEPEHHLVEGSPMTALFRAARANATPVADVAIALAPTGAQLVIDEGGWRHAARATAGPPGPGAAAGLFGHFREYAPAEGGYAYLDAAFREAPGGTAGAWTAEVETAEGTPARALIGARATTAAILAKGVEYADARVGFVPRP